MARKRAPTKRSPRRRTRLVPRVVLASAFASVVPVCVASCTSNGPQFSVDGGWAIDSGIDARAFSVDAGFVIPDAGRGDRFAVADAGFAHDARPTDATPADAGTSDSRTRG